MDGILIVAHGGGAEWNRPVREVAEQVRWDGPVRAGFQRGEEAGAAQEVRALVDDDGADRVAIVPLLVSRHSSHYQECRDLARLTGVPAVVTPALESAPELADVLTDRARDLVEAGPDRAAAHAVMVVGHGPNADADADRWLADLEPVTRRMAGTGGFAAVEAGLVRDDAGAGVRSSAVAAIRERIQDLHAATGQPVLVVPLLVSQGFLARERLPADLDGLPIHYSGRALAPHPGLARWVERMARKATAADPTRP